MSTCRISYLQVWWRVAGSKNNCMQFGACADLLTFVQWSAGQQACYIPRVAFQSSKVQLRRRVKEEAPKHIPRGAMDL